MTRYKILVSSIIVAAVLTSGFALAIEVSEVTVDFPLSEVLDIEAPESDATAQVSHKLLAAARGLDQLPGPIGLARDGGELVVDASQAVREDERIDVAAQALRRHVHPA